MSIAWLGQETCCKDIAHVQVYVQGTEAVSEPLGAAPGSLCIPEATTLSSSVGRLRCCCLRVGGVVALGNLLASVT